MKKDPREAVRKLLQYQKELNDQYEARGELFEGAAYSNLKTLLEVTNIVFEMSYKNSQSLKDISQKLSSRM